MPHEPTPMTGDERILGDITVLDVSQGIPAAWCTKLLAALGARVTLVEPPGGCTLRSLGPFAGDAPNPERGVSFLYLAQGKESVTLELDTEAGRTRFQDLAASADVLVEDKPPGAMAALGLGYDTLASANPRLIVASITPFGQNGPYRDYLITEIVAQALGGLMDTVGLPEREPLKIGGNPSLYNAGGAAFSAIMAAIWQRDATGVGQHIDVSIHEATALTQIHNSIHAAWHGEDAGRRPSNLLPAKDGWASVGLEMGVAPDVWPRVCAMIGRPELADDPRFATTAARRDNREALNDVVREWVSGQPKEAVYHQLQSLRSIAGYVATVEDLYASRQLAERAHFQEIDHPIAGPARYPGLPFRIEGMDWPSERAPLLGE